MADPCSKPLRWSKNFQVYVEKHNLYDVFQELLKKIILTKPQDPLTYIRDQFPRLAQGLYTPQAFIVGCNIAQNIGQRLAGLMGTKFLTIQEIIQSFDGAAKGQLSVFANGDNGDDYARKLLVEAIQKRIDAEDCEANGYVLFGFPQSKAQAVCAQLVGVLPRQVFVFLPESEELEEDEEGEDMLGKRGPVQKTQTDYLNMKDIAAAYHHEICETIPFNKLTKTKKSELESEMLGLLMTWKPSGAPFIPRVVLIGPPASGKTEIAEFLCKKLSLVNVDWIDLVRGAVRWNDESKVVAEAKEFLTDLKPMSEETVRKILTKRMLKDDCEKKGWVLHGFPENKEQCELLEEYFLTPNRIFMLSCSLEVSTNRMTKKKKAVMSRQLDEKKPARISEKGNILMFPFGEKSVSKRFENFTESLQGILGLYGARIVFVDASMKLEEVNRFVETSVLHPPIRRKKLTL